MPRKKTTKGKGTKPRGVKKPHGLPAGYQKVEPAKIPWWGTGDMKIAVGDRVQGILKRLGDSKFGGSMYAVETDDGVIGMPSHTALQRRLDNIEIDSLVHIVCVGIPEKSNDPYLYEVGVAF